MTSTVEDPHWAPPVIVLAKRQLTYATHLLVAEDEQAAGTPTAAGRITPATALPVGPGVFVLAEGGVVRYVGHSEHLARTFGPRGIGRITPKDCVDARRSEDCRLHALVVAAAAENRVIDVYLLADRSGPGRPWWRRREPVSTERAVSAEAARIRAACNCAWQGAAR